MPRPNVLFLTQVLPYPLDGGPKIRAYYVLRRLVQDYDVTLVSFTRPDDRPEHVTHLASLCEAVHSVPIRRSLLRNASAALKSIFSQQPIVIERDRNREMESQIAGLVQHRRFDVVHADQTSMAYYGLFAASLAGGTVMTLLDAHNALYQLIARQSGYTPWWQAPIWRREADLMAKYEAGLCQAFDRIVTVTEEDRQALLSLPGVSKSAAAKVNVIPICVDAGSEPPPREVHGPKIIFVGTMFWPPNIEGVLWFAREVLPIILDEIPAAELLVVGKNPPPTVKELADAPLPLGTAVKVLGYVEELEPLLSQSAVFIVPVLAGGGMRVKILTAWQWGIPIVTTTIGAEGIAVQNGQNIAIADAPEVFASAVLSILKNPELADKLRRNGRAWLAEQYHWERRYSELAQVYEEMLSELAQTDAGLNVVRGSIPI